MKITPYKTKKVIVGDSIKNILDIYLPKLHEKDIVVITSKIVSICQGNIVKNDGKVDKKALIKKNSELFYDDASLSRYGIVVLTIKNAILIANAGVDESNANNYFVLWPENVEKAAQDIWKYLKQKHNVKDLGVIITDSRLIPLRMGTLGVAIAWCGFEALKSYIDTPDIFGRHLKMTRSAILDGLAAGAVAIMGEGKEQTPLAIIADAPVIFQKRSPSKKELQEMKIPLGDDIYAPLLTSVRWKKGGVSSL